MIVLGACDLMFVLVLLLGALLLVRFIAGFSVHGGLFHLFYSLMFVIKVIKNMISQYCLQQCLPRNIFSKVLMEHY